MTLLAETASLFDLLPRHREFWDDFDFAIVDEAAPTTSDIGDARWIITADAGATQGIVAAGTNGSIFSLATDGDDNDEAYLATKCELFKFAAAKPMFCEALVSFTEASTDDANIMFGLMDAIGADSLLDDGGGPKASYSGAVFFKVDGSTNWQVENSIAGTQKTTDLTAANSLTNAAVTAGGAFQRLRIEHHPTAGPSGTTADILFLVDGILVAKHTDQLVTSATQMSVGFGAKAGGANAETLLADYVYGVQIR